MDIFTASVDSEPYKNICTRGSDGNPNSVKKAFSDLKCSKEKAYEWESLSKNYTRKFTRAKKCLQRRITDMSRFPARSNANKESRRKHIYPIQVAYTYGKDCARKIGTQEDVDQFQTSVNALIRRVSATQPDVATYFPRGMNASIEDPELQTLLQKPYFTKEQWNTIHKYRASKNTGNNVTAAYNSIILNELERNGYRQVESKVEENVGDVVRNLTSEITATTPKKHQIRRTRRKVRKVNAPAEQPNENLESLLLQHTQNSTSSSAVPLNYSSLVETWYKYIQMCQIRTIYEGCLDEFGSDYNGIRMYINKGLLPETESIKTILRQIRNTIETYTSKAKEYDRKAEETFAQLSTILNENATVLSANKFITNEEGLFSYLLALNQNKYNALPYEVKVQYSHQYKQILLMQQTIRDLSLEILNVSSTTAVSLRKQDDKTRWLDKKIKEKDTPEKLVIEFRNKLNQINAEISNQKIEFANKISELASQKYTHIFNIVSNAERYFDDFLLMYVTIQNLKDAMKKYNLAKILSMKISKTYWLSERSTILKLEDIGL